MHLPLFVSIPHSGEKVPEICPWLKGIPEPLLMCDVDRFVDQLYAPALQELQLPVVQTQWHRYAADLNRLPDDVDAGSVLGHARARGAFLRGFHWQITTKREVLMPAPMPLAAHEELVRLIYEPFHASVRQAAKNIRSAGNAEVFHLDLHSMPSLGTSEHLDPGERRAEIVVSDCKGKSSRSDFVDLVILSYVRAGFKVAYNWPYVGGRVSETYGHPEQGHHTVQVELNRSLYMNEETKQLEPRHQAVQRRLQQALKNVVNGLTQLAKSM